MRRAARNRAADVVTLPHMPIFPCIRHGLSQREGKGKMRVEARSRMCLLSDVKDEVAPVVWREERQSERARYSVGKRSENGLRARAGVGQTRTGANDRGQQTAHHW